jgi:hypothetical protein
MLICLKKLEDEFFFSQRRMKGHSTALADAVTVALSTAVTELSCRSQQCGKARSIFGSVACLSKLSRNTSDISSDTRRVFTKLILFYPHTLAVRSSFLLLINLRVS